MLEEVYPRSAYSPKRRFKIMPLAMHSSYIGDFPVDRR
jgi:hypothetical protein